MIIENLVRICSAQLLQKPSINAVTNITADPLKVVRGSAYFAYEANKDDVNEAISRGAYAIIFSDNMPIKDKEIAYIKVDCVTQAMFRIMRYEIEKRGINVVLSSILQFDMTKEFKLQVKSSFEPDCAKEFFSLIFQLENESYLFLKSDAVVQQIAPKYMKIEEKVDATILQSHTLFRSSFVYGEHFFKDLSLCSLFIPQFCAIISFLDLHTISFKVDTMEKMGHFEPYFVDLAMRKKAFGSTHQALILETDVQLFEKEALWLESRIPAKDLLFLAPHNTKTSLKCKRYTSATTIQTISPSSFKYLLILGDKKQIVDALEAPPPPAPTLF